MLRLSKETSTKTIQFKQDIKYLLNLFLIFQLKFPNKVKPKDKHSITLDLIIWFQTFPLSIQLLCISNNKQFLLLRFFSARLTTEDNEVTDIIIMFQWAKMVHLPSLDKLSSPKFNIAGSLCWFYKTLKNSKIVK